jgi:hypothetical protein
VYPLWVVSVVEQLGLPVDWAGWEIFSVVFLVVVEAVGAVAWAGLHPLALRPYPKQVALAVVEPEASARMLLLRPGLPEIPYPYSGDNLWP